MFERSVLSTEATVVVPCCLSSAGIRQKEDKGIFERGRRLNSEILNFFSRTESTFHEV